MTSGPLHRPPDGCRCCDCQHGRGAYRSAHGKGGRGSYLGRRRTYSLHTSSRLVALFPGQGTRPTACERPPASHHCRGIDVATCPENGIRSGAARPNDGLGHWRGVPFSGKRNDAFPSGHAVHIGALASAASDLPANQRNMVWSIGTGLVLTRIVLMAHWASDVAVGLAAGAIIERLLRRATGYGSEPSRAANRPRELRHHPPRR